MYSPVWPKFPVATRQRDQDGVRDCCGLDLWDAEDDGDVRESDVDSLHQAANDLPSSAPIRILDSWPEMSGELSEMIHKGLQFLAAAGALGLFAYSSFELRDASFRSTQPWGELLLFDRAFGVRVNQSLQAALQFTEFCFQDFGMLRVAADCSFLLRILRQSLWVL